MAKVIINDNQRGFLFKDGRFVKMLGTGKYYTFGSREIEVVSAVGELRSERCTPDVLLADPDVKTSVSCAEVPDQHIAFHFVNGIYTGVLKRGTYRYWSLSEKHEFQVVSTAGTEVPPDLPAYIIDKLPEHICRHVFVNEYQKARLFLNGRLDRILEPGVYHFWNNEVQVDVSYADTRRRQMDITGQEIMTSDKVSLRISFVCSYRITDFVKSYTEVDDFEEQIHVTAQLAMRDFIGRHRLDEILESKEALSQFVVDRLKSHEDEFFAEITDGGVKDIILPGEIRDIMNTVLVAEKRAQANVITRREEVASTHSLLNTAKLMEENEVLFKLKELEYIERICEHVGSINLNGSGDILAQLTSVLGRGKAS